MLTRLHLGSVVHRLIFEFIIAGSAAEARNFHLHTACIFDIQVCVEQVRPHTCWDGLWQVRRSGSESPAGCARLWRRPAEPAKSADIRSRTYRGNRRSCRECFGDELRCDLTDHGAKCNDPRVHRTKRRGRPQLPSVGKCEIRPVMIIALPTFPNRREWADLMCIWRRST